jgi:Resolvase, N terminal domain
MTRDTTWIGAIDWHLRSSVRAESGDLPARLNRPAGRARSFPFPRAQTEAWVLQRGWRIVAEYVEPGASATDDKRSEFQRMIGRACNGENAFDVIVVHSFSRFFRKVEGRGSRIKKKLAIDAVEAETVQLMFRLFLEADSGSGPMGVKSIAVWLNERGYRTRSGATWVLDRSTPC